MQAPVKLSSAFAEQSWEISMLNQKEESDWRETQELPVQVLELQGSG
jgi:hypothetical protein